MRLNEYVEDLAKVFDVVSRVLQDYGDITLQRVEVKVESDLEIPSWVYVTVRLYMDGDYDRILDFWSRVSKEASTVLGEHVKNVFILIE